MFKPVRNVYTIKTSPYNDNEKLENLLNEMSKDGWELYSMQELENGDDVFYNCIFTKETELEDDLFDSGGLFDFKPKIERILNPELEPYESCIDILKKIKDKRQKISQVKALIDDTSEDSRSVLNDEISKHINELEELRKNLLKVLNPDIMENKLGEARLSISLSEESAVLLDSSADDNLLAQIVYIRQNLTETLGYIIPKIKIEIDDTLDESEIYVKVRGIPAVNAYVYPGRTMFYENELNIDKMPEEAVKSFDEIRKQNTVWINNKTADDFWVKGLSASEYTAALIEHTVIKYIDDIFDYSDVNRYIEIAGNQNLFLVENIIPDFISISELKYLLTGLIKERVSIKDIVFIFEKLNDFSAEENNDDLLQKLRITLARQISSSLSTEGGIIQAYELSPESLAAFDEIQKGNHGEVIKIKSSLIEKIISRLHKLQSKNLHENKFITLIVPLELRHIIYLVLSPLVSDIRITAREELSFEYPLQILGKV